MSDAQPLFFPEIAGPGGLPSLRQPAAGPAAASRGPGSDVLAGRGSGNLGGTKNLKPQPLKLAEITSSP